MRWRRARQVGLVGLLLLEGCAVASTVRTVARYERLQTAFARRAWDDALAATQSGDPLWVALHRAAILRAAGRYAESNAAFREAEGWMAARQSHSVRRALGSLVLSDRVLAFRPTPTEGAFVDAYQALNYLDLGDDESAAAVARGALRRWAAGPTPCPGEPFVPWWVAMVFELTGRGDEAAVAARAATACGAPLRLAERQKRVWWWVEMGYVPAPFPVRLDLPIAPADTAGWLRWTEADWEARSRTWRDRWRALAPCFPSCGWDGPVLSVIWPWIPPLPLPTRVEVTTGEGATSRAALLLPVADRVREETEAKLPAVVLRAILRHAIRGALVENLLADVGERSSERDDAAASEAVRAERPSPRAVAAVAAIASAVVEAPDLRRWVTLPAAVALVPLDLPPGRHSVRLIVDGATVATDTVTATAGPPVLRHVRIPWCAPPRDAPPPRWRFVRLEPGAAAPPRDRDDSAGSPPPCRATDSW